MGTMFLAAGIADVAGEDSGLFMVMLLLAFCWLAVLAISLLLALCLLGLIAAAIAAGIFSVAAVIGFCQRSVRTGYVWFVRLSFQLLGILLFVFYLYLITELPWYQLWLYAFAAGIAIGYTAERSFHFVIKRSYNYLIRKNGY